MGSCRAEMSLRSASGFQGAGNRHCEPSSQSAPSTPLSLPAWGLSSGLWSRGSCWGCRLLVTHTGGLWLASGGSVLEGWEGQITKS